MATRSNIDSRNILRGGCNVCNCAKYNREKSGNKCADCTHPPSKHRKLETRSSNPHSQNSQAFDSVSSAPFVPTIATIPTPSPSHPSTTTSGVRYPAAQQYDYGIYTTYYGSYQQPVIPPPRLLCKAPGCSSFRYFDPIVGVFDYCSPDCRDNDLLPTEQKNLREHLKAFKDELKSSALHETNGRDGNKSSLGQTRGSDSIMISGASAGSEYEGSGSSFQSDSRLPNQQKRVVFQKSPSEDINFILASEKYECDTFSGILVLGFEYNTKAEYLIKKGEIHLLDVITLLNEKEACLFTYPDEMKKGACTLIVNRSIALPEIKTLMEKAEHANPTHLVAIMNPRNVPRCSTAEGFGFETTCSGGIFVSSIRENTPATFSRLKRGDEIVAFSFVKDELLTCGKDHLRKKDLEAAASNGETLILVIKKKP